MKFSSSILILTAVSLAACASKTPPRTIVGGPMPPPSAEAVDQGPPLANDVVAKQVFDAVNNERAKSGLKPLSASPELARSAQEHSDKMLSSNFLATRGADEPSVITRITSSGVKTLKLGENVIRIKTRSDHVADESMNIWNSAAADRKNIVSTQFTKAGVGVARAADGDYYVSEDFAE
jgi:uncharacterized protein YkwD